MLTELATGAWDGVSDNGQAHSCGLWQRATNSSLMSIRDGLQARLEALTTSAANAWMFWHHGRPARFLARREAALLDAEIAWTEHELDPIHHHNT